MSYNYPTTKDSSHNEIKVPMNTKNICGVDCYEQNGVAYLRLENVARGLGFTRIAASGNEVIMWSRVEKYLEDLGVHTCAHDDFIPEISSISGRRDYSVNSQEWNICY